MQLEALQKYDTSIRRTNEKFQGCKARTCGGSYPSVNLWILEILQLEGGVVTQCKACKVYNHQYNYVAF